jgi:hypothetical protein
MLAANNFSLHEFKELFMLTNSLHKNRNTNIWRNADSIYGWKFQQFIQIQTKVYITVSKTFYYLISEVAFEGLHYKQ